MKRVGGGGSSSIWHASFVVSTTCTTIVSAFIHAGGTTRFNDVNVSGARQSKVFAVRSGVDDLNDFALRDAASWGRRIR